MRRRILRLKSRQRRRRIRRSLLLRLPAPRRSSLPPPRRQPRSHRSWIRCYHPSKRKAHRTPASPSRALFGIASVNIKTTPKKRIRLSKMPKLVQAKVPSRNRSRLRKLADLVVAQAMVPHHCDPCPIRPSIRNAPTHPLLAPQHALQYPQSMKRRCRAATSRALLPMAPCGNCTVQRTTCRFIMG